MVALGRGARSLLAAAVIVAVAAAAGAALWSAESAMAAQLAGERRTIGELQREVAAVETRDGPAVDWPAVAADVEPSVATVEAGDSLGSAWVVRAGADGSELVTNYHVVAGAWSAGNAMVQVRLGDRRMPGEIVRVDPGDDLAVVGVAARLPSLGCAQGRPRLGSPVMAVGSPLGLDGSVSVGVVSGYRSLDGSDYIQFSAPISPGNSGGPVVDRDGRVIGVTSSKLVGSAVEGLSLAIPIDVVSSTLIRCAA